MYKDMLIFCAEDGVNDGRKMKRPVRRSCGIRTIDPDAAAPFVSVQIREREAFLN